ncbi:Rpn family recombination-promoting nuclease/putative transposase [Treponema sp.]|uniref:Rpn family recombination-promoting nuclease/putative transposase n=1 Tax=Treponema sp. TaxID=166 RepID=UPI0026008311|nr:Rpn family recombination-promoting nuclease/putative transposase [Treponema sp.]
MPSFLDTIDPAMLARIQAMRLMDDDFMTVVFDGDNEITEFLLRILLNRDDLRVKKVTTQKEKRNLFGRSVRLDILAEDTKGKLYNVEVQRADEGASPKRVRYNQAMLDSHSLKKKEDFTQLPETYIIFITENDYYGLGQPFYKVRKTIELATTDSTYLPFDDGCNIIYVNGRYRGDDALGKLMHDFCTPNADEMNYSELAEKVRYHKQETEGVRTMCRIVEEYGKERAAEARKIALAEGLKRGLKRGVQENAIANAKNFLQEGDSPEKIARCCSLPLEQVLALKEELSREAAGVTK